MSVRRGPSKAHPLTYGRLGYRNLRAAEAGFDVADA
jgi:hypothetical protein